MPRATAPKSNTTTSKPTKTTTKVTKPKTNETDPPPTASLSVDTPDSTAVIPKDLLLQIVLAKLEGSKTCDWFELSKVVNARLGTGSKEALGLGKKSKKAKEEGWTGTDLSELYSSTILPGLKSGKIVCLDGPVPTARARTHTRGRSSTSSGDTKVDEPITTTKGGKKRKVSDATATSDNATEVKAESTKAKAKKDAAEEANPPAKKSRTTSSSSAKDTTTKSKTQTKVKHSPTSRDTATRGVRSSRKSISYREDMMTDDDAKLKMPKKKEMEEDEGGEEEIKEDQEMDSDEEEEGEEDEGAVKELENEGMEDELDEDGVEDGADE